MEGFAAFPVYSKSMKINPLASVRRHRQATICRRRDFCPSRKCQQGESSNPSLDGTPMAFGRLRREDGMQFCSRFGTTFLQGIHLPLLSAAIHSRHSFACSRPRVASGSGSCMALDSYSAAFLSSSARTFSGGTIFMVDYLMAALWHNPPTRESPISRQRGRHNPCQAGGWGSMLRKCVVGAG